MTKKTNETNSIIALFFDSGRFDETFYGGVVFAAFFKGLEIKKNNTKIIISAGDVFGDAYQDINPYLVKDEFCTVDFSSQSNHSNFKDYPYCWIIEDIDIEIALEIDKRLKKELNKEYKGMTRIDVLSKDEKKQFWKSLIRDFSFFDDTITVFNLEDYGFRYQYLSDQLGFVVIYDEKEWFEETDEGLLPASRISSFVSEQSDLEIVKGKKDIDRSILEMSFSLVKEVSIAGVFIWKSIEDIDKLFFPFMDGMPYITDHIFTSMYEASQGIERLQKIIIELIVYRDKIPSVEFEKIEKLLLSHNHLNLHEWIASKEKLKKISKKATSMLVMLYDFYKNARYSRFNKNTDRKLEATVFKKFVESFKANASNDEDKHLFGKALGELSYIYYKLIQEISRDLNIYAYEIPTDSPSVIVFRDHPNLDLYETYCRIKQAKKELIWWIAKNPKNILKENILGENNYLDFDPAMIRYYIDEIIRNKNGSNELFDEVDFLYDELFKENKVDAKNRISLIDAAVGNLNVSFDDDLEEEEE